MNKFLKALAVFVLAFSSEAYAQNSYIRNDTPTTLYGTDLMIGNRAAVDSAGRLKVVISAGSSSSAMAEATVIPQITAVPGSTAIPSAATTPQFVNTTALCTTFVQNNTNVDLDAHLKGAATASHRVPAGTEWYENWCANGQKMSGNIGVFVPSTSNTPASGQIVIGGSSR